MSVVLDEPASILISCEDNDIGIFESTVPEDVMTSLHASNIRPLLKFIEYNVGITEDTELHSIAKWYTKHLGQVVNDLGIKIQECKDNIDETDEFLCQQMNESIAALVRRKDKADLVKEVIAARLETFVQPVHTKKAAFKKIMEENIISDGSSKWLIVNDDVSALFTYQNHLQAANVTCELLDGGNSDQVTKTIENYKSGKTQVLLLNSASEGCGLNLENTTHIVFTHATKSHLVEQIVGRAQRYGRESKLTIIGLFNMMELKTLENGGLHSKE
jgi:SNF2 family DNA or RNA helicase